MKIKGFKHTGNGPKSGHSFSSQSGFSGSTGGVQNVRGYSRATPKPKAPFAEGGVVRVAESVSPSSGSNKSVTTGNAKARAQAAFAPVAKEVKGMKASMDKASSKACYAEGGKVGSLVDALKMVDTLVKRGSDPHAAAQAAAARHSIPTNQLLDATAKKGVTGDPKMLAQGGKVGFAPRRAGPIKIAQAPAPAILVSPLASAYSAGPTKSIGRGSFNRRPIIGGE